MPSKTVFITGCSDGGLGAALAIAFKEAGYRVIASARNPAKLSEMKNHNIEVVELDVCSEESIKTCVRIVHKIVGGKLDILVNNAGVGYSMPAMDLDLSAVRKVFEVNVISLISVSREFLPLLRAAPHPMLVNNTSIVSVFGVPFQSAYNASKAAAGMFTHNLRQELEPFGIRVIDLKTGGVASNFFKNATDNGMTPKLPPDSIYMPGKDIIESTLSGEAFRDGALPASEWASQVVRDLSKSHPPALVWRGGSAIAVKYGSIFPLRYFDRMVKKMTGLDVFEEKLRTSV